MHGDQVPLLKMKASKYFANSPLVVFLGNTVNLNVHTGSLFEGKTSINANTIQVIWCHNFIGIEVKDTIIYVQMANQILYNIF